MYQKCLMYVRTCECIYVCVRVNWGQIRPKGKVNSNNLGRDLEVTQKGGSVGGARFVTGGTPGLSKQLFNI